MQTENKKMDNTYDWIKEIEDEEQLLIIRGCLNDLEEAYKVGFTTKSEIRQALVSLRYKASNEAKIIMLGACVDSSQKKLDEVKFRKYIA